MELVEESKNDKNENEEEEQSGYEKRLIKDIDEMEQLQERINQKKQ